MNKKLKDNRLPIGFIHAKYCHETPDGGVEIRVGEIRHNLDPGMFFDCGPSLRFAFEELRDQPWLSSEILAELFTIAAGRALAVMVQEVADLEVELNPSARSLSQPFLITGIEQPDLPVKY